MITIKKAKRMDNYSGNKIILRRLADLIENSKEVGFQKILNVAGITSLFEISLSADEDDIAVISGADVEEDSVETINRMNILNN